MIYLYDVALFLSLHERLQMSFRSGQQAGVLELDSTRTWTPTMASGASGQRFSTLASKFLNQSLLPSVSITTNEPLFYSMAEGSHEGDDEDDPHLRRSRGPGQEYDPFNLDDIPDDEREDIGGLDVSLGDAQDSLPLLLQSNWRQAPRQPQRQPKSPSPESSLSPSDNSLPLGLDMFEDDRPPPRGTLTESLLPRNPDAPFVFSLPVPGRIPRRKYNDVAWANLWYASVAICAVGFILTLFLTHVSRYTGVFFCSGYLSSLKKPRSSPGPLLYTTLTHTVPLITIFTVIAALASYLIIALLRVAVKPVLMGTSVAVPVIMIIAAAWAFAGSFAWTGKEGGWAETVGFVVQCQQGQS